MQAYYLRLTNGDSIFVTKAEARKFKNAQKSGKDEILIRYYWDRDLFSKYDLISAYSTEDETYLIKESETKEDLASNVRTQIVIGSILVLVVLLCIVCYFATFNTPTWERIREWRRARKRQRKKRWKQQKKLQRIKQMEQAGNETNHGDADG